MENQSEREILLLGNLQHNSKMLRPTYLNPKEKIYASFFAPIRKNQTQIFSCFLPRFLCRCTDCIVWTSNPCPDFFLENCACCTANRTVRTLWSSNKCFCLLLDFCALSAAVLSLDLRAANFFSFLEKNGNFLS